MKTLVVNRKYFMFIVVILLIGFGTQGSYGQTITASTPQPLTEATLHESVVTLTLNGGTYERSSWDIERALMVSGIDGVTFERWEVERVSDTVVTIELEFNGNIDTDATLTFTVGAGAIAGYSGNALTATVPVTAVAESLEASPEFPLTETNLHGSVVTLMLSGRRFADREWDIEDAVSLSGIDGAAVSDRYLGVERVSNTEVKIRLTFNGDFDTDATLTLTVGADAIAGYNQAFTFQFPVTAVEESLVASTESPLTEATLHGSIVTLTLTGRSFADREWDIEDAVSVSGIDGVTVGTFGLDRVSDTVVTMELEFAGNIDADATLTVTVGADAIGGYNQAFTFQFPVTAVEESLDASTESPLTEATLHGSIVTLTLTGRSFADREWDIEDAVSVSGIDGVTVGTFGLDRVSDTVVTMELEFAGNIDADATLTVTVGADAIGGYNQAFTFQFPVTAVEESLDASTESPLTEATLHGSIVTLTLTGRSFADRSWDIEGAVSLSGIDGVTFDSFRGVDRVSDTEVTIELTFNGDFDTDTTLTLTVGADAIGGYNQAFTFQFPVTAVEESLDASTESPLTEAILHGSIITLTLTGRQFADEWEIGDAVSVSGINSATLGRRAVDRVSDTVAIVKLAFDGNIDTDTTLTLTVGADAIAGYNQAFTFEFPVTAVEESLVVSTGFSLTEANLDGSIITLALSGRQFADEWEIGDAMSVSGIEGVTFERWNIERVSDTEVAVKLEFDGTDFDTDATLTVTMESDAIAGYNQGVTAQFPVTATPKSNATVSISPLLVVSPAIDEQLTFSLNIKGGENVAGYQATVSFDYSALDYVRSANGNYLPADAFFADPSFQYGGGERGVTLAANTLAGGSNGAGTLATLTFEVVDFKASRLTLTQLYLVDSDGKRWEATTQNGTVTVPPEPAEVIVGDIDRNGVVNIQDLAIVNARFGQRGENSADLNGDGLVDIVDLVLVAAAFDEEAAAPSLYPQALELFTAADVRQWLNQAQGLHLTDPTFQRGIRFLEQLLTVLAPKETTLLPNYPNPFNPETWIPYRLAEDAFVTLTIYDNSGRIVRTLDVGHRVAAFYESRAKAIHWDGRNEFGEQVASGVYFYHLSAGDFSATRKMLILK